MTRKDVCRKYDVISIMMLIVGFWKSFKFWTCIFRGIKFELNANILTRNGYKGVDLCKKSF